MTQKNKNPNGFGFGSTSHVILIRQESLSRILQISASRAIPTYNGFKEAEPNQYHITNISVLTAILFSNSGNHITYKLLIND